MIEKQIKAARAFLDWTRDDLAEASGLSVPSIKNLEDGHSPTQKTIGKVKRALEKNGIVFTEDGVRFTDSSNIKLEGDDWFVEVLEDALNTLKSNKNKEILLFGADDRVSPPAVIEAFQRLASAGVKIREMVEEGNDYILGEEENYRWIPKTYFRNYVTVIYADKHIIDFGNYGIMIQDRRVTDARRNEFEYMWSTEKPLKIKSSANVRYKV